MTIQFSKTSVTQQLNRLEVALQALGQSITYIGLIMMGAINDEVTHKATLNSVILHCPNLKALYAAALYIKDQQFASLTLKPFFGRLEKITLQMSTLDGTNDIFSDCKNLKQWHQQILYGFDARRLNFNFPKLETIIFSKVDNIDNETLTPFLMKNPQLKRIDLTRCAINPTILMLLAKHVPNLEAFAFNFRRQLINQNDMLENLKYLLEMQHLWAINLDCCGIPVAGTILKIGEKKIPLERVGLFCCPWQNMFIKSFASLKDLKSLTLANIEGLTDDYLGNLSESLSQLVDLTLKYNKRVTINGVIKLVNGAKRLTDINLCLEKLSMNGEQYNLLLEAVKGRPETCKLTVNFFGLDHSIRVSRDLLNRNVDILEIYSEDYDINRNTDFDFYCGGDGGGDDGGYDLVTYAPSPNCNVN